MRNVCFVPRLPTKTEVWPFVLLVESLARRNLEKYENRPENRAEIVEVGSGIAVSKALGRQVGLGMAVVEALERQVVPGMAPSRPWNGVFVAKKV